MEDLSDKSVKTYLSLHGYSLSASKWLSLLISNIKNILTSIEVCFAYQILQVVLPSNNFVFPLFTFQH